MVSRPGSGMFWPSPFTSFGLCQDTKLAPVPRRRLPARKAAMALKWSAARRARAKPPGSDVDDGCVAADLGKQGRIGTGHPGLRAQSGEFAV